MNELFPFGELKKHEFYHLRYGKGAVIVAIPIEDVEEQQLAWDQERRELFKQIRTSRKSLRAEISKLKEKLINSGKVNELSTQNKPVEEKIIELENNLSSMAPPHSKYFSLIQIAQFYTHNITSQNDIHTRFDKVSSICEMGNFIDITLHFSDLTTPSHHYQQMTGINTLPTFPCKTGQLSIEGNIRRIIPKDSVTLEIVCP